MRKVWKYTIDLDEGIDPVFIIPGGGRFLSLRDREVNPVHPSHFKIDTWWAVDDENVPTEVQLHIRGTGLEVPPSVNYLGTAFPAPDLVLHVWEKDRVFTDMHIVDGKFVSKSQ